MKQTVEEQAIEYAKAYFPEQEYIDKYMLGKKSGYIRGFIQGAEWRIDSVWHNADEKPKDGEYLTILKVNEKIVIEIAPWKNGKYQGSHHIEVYIGKTEVVKYADIHELLPKGVIE